MSSATNPTSPRPARRRPPFFSLRAPRSRRTGRVCAGLTLAGLLWAGLGAFPAEGLARGTHRVRRDRAAAPPAAPAEPEPTIPVTFLPGAPEPPRILARSAIVVDARNGKVLYEKNPDERRPVASTTKLLTALIIAESGGLDNPVQIDTLDTLCEPTKAYVRPGEIYSRRYLLYALLIHSCNDLARALARDNAGSLGAFAAKMNQRSAQMGAANSLWSTPNGLPSPGAAQYSTARDLSRVARWVYSSPVLRPIVRTPRMIFQYNNGRTAEFTNTNRVLLRYPLCNGMKTGYTEAAGHCLVSSAATESRDVIAVLLGDNKSIWSDSQNMLAWALGLNY